MKIIKKNGIRTFEYNNEFYINTKDYFKTSIKQYKDKGIIYQGDLYLTIDYCMAITTDLVIN